VERKLNSRNVLDALGELFLGCGPPEHIRSDNGPEFIANDLRQWLQQLNVKNLYIEPGSPSENGYCESFYSKLRDELLAREIFYTLKEAQILIGQWRIYCNTERTHSSLSYRPPAPQQFCLHQICCHIMKKQHERCQTKHADSDRTGGPHK